MEETNVVAAILTVASYTGRGGAMSLPQIISTYYEILDLLAKDEFKKKNKKK